MEDIIAPIDRELLKSELTAERRLRSTNKSHNEIYIVNWKNAPIRSWAIIVELYGTFKIPIQALRIEAWYNHIAAGILSAGIISFSLTIHNPIVSPTISVSIDNIIPVGGINLVHT